MAIGLLEVQSLALMGVDARRAVQMNDSTFTPISIYALPVEEEDLAFFDRANDLPISHAAADYDHKRIDANIEQKAREAQLQSDAESALMLARLFRDDAHRHLEQLEIAEAAAFTLGQHSYQINQRPHGNYGPHGSYGSQRNVSVVRSPFTDHALSTAWNNGYTEAARNQAACNEVVSPPVNALEAKLWNEGIDTDRADSQFELAALALLRLADTVSPPGLKVRAQRLAQEMLCYHQGAHTPSPRRQQEIDRFLQLQTRRLAAAIDFTSI